MVSQNKERVFGLNIVYNRLKGLNVGKPIQLNLLMRERIKIKPLCGLSLGLSFAYFGFRLFRPPRLINKHIIGIFKKRPSEAFLFFNSLTPRLNVLPRMLLKLSFYFSCFRVFLSAYRQRFVFKKRKLRVTFNLNKSPFQVKKLQAAMRGTYRRASRFIYRFNSVRSLLLSRVVFNFLKSSTYYRPIIISDNFLWDRQPIGSNVFLNWRGLVNTQFTSDKNYGLMLKSYVYNHFISSFFTRSVLSVATTLKNNFGIFSKNMQKANTGSMFNYLVLRFLNFRVRDRLMTRVMGIFGFSGYGFITRSTATRRRFSRKPNRAYFGQRIVLFKMFKIFWSLKKVYKVKNSIGKLNKIRYFRVSGFIRRFLLRLNTVVGNFFSLNKVFVTLFFKFNFFKVNGLFAKKEFQYLRKFDVLTVEKRVFKWLKVLRAARRYRKTTKYKFIQKDEMRKKKERVSKWIDKNIVKKLKTVRKLKRRVNNRLRRVNRRKYLALAATGTGLEHKAAHKVVAKFRKYVNFFKQKRKKKLKKRRVAKRKWRLVKRKMLGKSRRKVRVGTVTPRPKRKEAAWRNLLGLKQREKKVRLLPLKGKKRRKKTKFQKKMARFKRFNWLRRRGRKYARRIDMKERVRTRRIFTYKTIKAKIAKVSGSTRGTKLKRLTKVGRRFKNLPVILLNRRRGLVFWSFRSSYAAQFFKRLGCGLRIHNAHRLLSRRLA